MIRRLSRVSSAELEGVDAKLITIETDLSVGLSVFSIVGLADKALSEAKERINSALKNSGFRPPSQNNFRLIVNLAPADIQKTGSQYDLGIAVGYLLSSGEIKCDCQDRILFIGELSLDGSLRPVRGVLNIAHLAKKQGFEGIIVPPENAAEAALIEGITVIPAKNLVDTVSYLSGQVLLPAPPSKFTPDYNLSSDFSDIRGQEFAKRAMTIAAAGGHNIIMVGPPGSGKTALAKCLPSILPPISVDEAVSVSKNWSAAGLLSAESPFLKSRPFRDPHHTSSSSAIIGGGTNPRPGEISLAHNGILFLDELPEFHRDVLESLRTPLESGIAKIARSRGTLSFPARFQLISAMNPCPCGYYGDPEVACKCSAREIYKYQKKVSGPLLDRIDIQINVPRLKISALKTGPRGESSADMREKVLKAADFSRKRFSRLGLQACSNSTLSSRECDDFVKLSSDADELLKQIFDRTAVSGRGYYRILKVARTIADLGESKIVESDHLAEAFQYRLKTED